MSTTNWRSRPRKKRSAIWLLPKEDLIQIVNKSETISEILAYFSLSNKGGNYKTLKSRLDEEEIDYTHIPLGLNSNKNRPRGGVIPLSDEEVFVKNSTYNRTHLKKRIRNKNLIPYTCGICYQQPIWRNQELVLVLDHINGVFNDNRLENLRFLCPNCDSQTETFAGRNKSSR